MICAGSASLGNCTASLFEQVFELAPGGIFTGIFKRAFELAKARIAANPPATDGNPLLEQLAALPPLALPQPVSWWPAAPGWWLCAAIVLLLCTLGARYTLRRRRRRAAIDDLLAQLNGYYAAWQQQHDTERYLYNANALLRRCCNHYFPTRTSPALRGPAWLAQLDTLVAEPCLHNAAGQQLLLQYQAAPHADIDALHQVLKAWGTQLEIHPPRRSKTGAVGMRGAT